MKEKYIKDLKEIKEIMNRSNRFISLSGLSGVSTGVVALGGVYLAYQTLFKGHDYLVYNAIEISYEHITRMLLLALGTLLLSIASALFFTRLKSKKSKLGVQTPQVRELLFNLLIPLLTGGVLCLILLFKGFVGMLPPLTLLFYGLALVNGSKYTLSELKTLGIIQIILGLLAFQFIGYGLVFWALGFGIIQMVYGFIVQHKYRS